MKIIYIHHSGFALEGNGYTILIDFYKDTNDKNDGGIVSDYLLKRSGKFYVLASHSHPDHFNREILEWRKERHGIQYIFSSDIFDSKKARADDAVYLNHSDIFQDNTLTIKAYGSTDVGISFYIEAEGKKIFHAGDLNNWHWNEESTPEEIKEAEDFYKRELDILSNDVSHLDIAMFPVDNRLGKEYMKGARQFVDAIRVDFFLPMHFGEHYQASSAFRDYAESKGCHFGAITHKGQTFNRP